MVLKSHLQIHQTSSNHQNLVSVILNHHTSSTTRCLYTIDTITMSNPWDFFATQFATVPENTRSFQGQTVIVTGSNIGLGLEAARQYVKLDASKVIIAVRSIKKGEIAAADIASTTGRDGVCEVWHLDLGNFDSVKEFAKRAQGLDRLDVVNENAGIATSKYEQMDGFESTVAVNVVGTFLLALLLLPKLKESMVKTGNVPRLSITSSEVHFWVILPLYRCEISSI